MIKLLRSLTSRFQSAEPRFELKPNCLLTRSPIYLIGANWNHIPELLHSHGYQVQQIPLLAPHLPKAHIFLSADFCPLVAQQLRAEENHASVTLLRNTPAEKYQNELYWPQGLHPLTERELWLQFVISLAEMELLNND